MCGALQEQNRRQTQRGTQDISKCVPGAEETHVCALHCSCSVLQSNGCKERSALRLAAFHAAATCLLLHGLKLPRVSLVARVLKVSFGSTAAKKAKARCCASSCKAACKDTAGVAAGATASAAVAATVRAAVSAFVSLLLPLSLLLLLMSSVLVLLLPT